MALREVDPEEGDETGASVESLVEAFLRAQSGEWKSMSEVAEAVGRSRGTVRKALARRLMAGSVETRKNPGRKGQQWKFRAEKILTDQVR